MVTPDIAGYTIEGELGRGARGVVYRAVRGQVTYAIKVQADDSLLSLGANLACIRHPGLPEVVEVGRTGEQAYLVREYIEGHTLAAELDTRTLPEPHIVELAKTLAGALEQVHQRGLVHLDVKPANILVGKGGSARLIDFGFASRVGETSGAVGTYLYSAPEQTGVLDSAVDQRADLYALGAVLFECAAGQPPFRADNTADLLRMHGSEPVPQLPGTNSALAAIIRKLLSKDPRDRYQTGQSLVADLRSLRRLQRQFDQGGELKLGTVHRELRSQSTAMVGRESQLDELKSVLQRVSQGRGQSVLLEGDGGSGKSLLVQDFLKTAVHPVVLHARCEQRESPFASVRTWIDGYFQELKKFPDAQINHFRSGWREFGIERARYLSGISQVAERFFGVKGTQVSEAGDQMLDATATFFLHLARLHGCLVLSLDDAHHIDEGSQQVLMRIQMGLGRTPLMLVATSRMAGAHKEGLERYVMAARPSLRLSLEPLDVAEIELLVYAILGARPVSHELIRQVAAKSRGNPFAATEYVRAMLDSGVILPGREGWNIDVEGLQSLSLPDDVLQLVLQRVSLLDEKVHSLLTLAAVYGTRFDLELLAMVADRDPTRASQELEKAVMAHVVEHSDKNPEGNTVYLFVHDRVREAFLSELKPAEEKGLHLKVARGLSELLVKRPGLLYAVARHFALGEGAAGEVYRTNLEAGQKALHESAFEAAHGFLSEARQCAQDALWREPLSQAAERTGRVEEAVSLLEQLLEADPEPLKKAQYLSRLAKLSQSKLDRSDAREDCRRALAAVGVNVVDHPLGNILRAAFYFGRWAMAEWLGWGRGKAQGQERERVRTLAELYQLYSESEFFDMQYPKMLEMGAHSCMSSFRLGVSSEMITSYSNMSIAFGLAKKPNLIQKWGKKVRAIAEELNDPVALSHHEVTHRIALHIAGLCREEEVGMAEILESRTQLMNPWAFLIGVADLAYVLILKGYVKRAWYWVEQGLERAEMTSSPTGVVRDVDILGCYAISCLAVLDRRGESLLHVERLRDKPGDRSLRANFYAHLLMLYLETGEIGEPLLAAGRGYIKLGLRPRLTPWHRRHFYVLWCYALLERARLTEEPRDTLDQAMEMLKQTSNRPLLRCHYLVARGARQALEKEYQEALQSLAEAQQLADLNDVPWASFEICRVRARVFNGMSNYEVSAREAAQAYRLALDLGWPCRARLVAQEFSLGQTNATNSLSASATASAQKSIETAEHVRKAHRLEKLLQLNLTSARLMDPVEQTRHILDALINILNAERAFLFLQDGQKLDYEMGRDRDGENLPAPEGYSRTVVDTVYRSRQSLLLAGTEQGQAIGAQSVVAHDLRSVICTPLSTLDGLVGVIYLDNRLARGMFAQDDIQVLEALAGQVALALESARATRLQKEVRERQQAQKVLQGSLDRSRRLLEGAQAIAATSDRDEIFQQVDHTASQLFGHQALICIETDSEGQAAGKILSSSEAVDRKLALELASEVVTGGEPLLLRQFSGTDYKSPVAGLQSLMAVSASLESGAGLLLMALGSHPGQFDKPDLDVLNLLALQMSAAFNNITLQGQVLQASKLAAVGQLAAGVAHELNNPLGAVALTLESVAALTENPNALSRLQQAEAGLERASRIVSSLLLYGKPDNDPGVQQVDLNEIVSEAVERLDYALGKFTLSLELSPAPLLLEGNADHLRQLVNHLLLNASDAIRGQEERKVVLTTKEGHWLYVDDNGPGLSGEVAARAMEPFFTTKPVGRGTGLGLSICDRVAKQHGGTVEFGTSPLGGARFTVSLPNIEKKPGANPAPSSSEVSRR